MGRTWLADFSWDAVTAINAQLCAAQKALHRPTSDGHESARELWENTFHKETTLADAVELCRQCHRLAPFCFFNGNTFAAIIGVALRQLPQLDRAERNVLQSIVGHIVAGTAHPEEERQFHQLLAKLE